MEKGAKIMKEDALVARLGMFMILSPNFLRQNRMNIEPISSGLKALTAGKGLRRRFC